MADAEHFNADQRAFWNGPGGRISVARQEHTDINLAPVSEALLALAAPRTGERVLDVGCGCDATTLELARGVGGCGVYPAAGAGFRDPIPPFRPVTWAGMSRPRHGTDRRQAGIG